MDYIYILYGLLTIFILCLLGYIIYLLIQGGRKVVKCQWCDSNAKVMYNNRVWGMKNVPLCSMHLERIVKKQDKRRKTDAKKRN